LRWLVQKVGTDPDRAAARAWRLAFGRPITPKEAARARSFLAERTGGSSSGFESALAELCLALFNANEFVYMD
jgi:hypothetical protein